MEKINVNNNTDESWSDPDAPKGFEALFGKQADYYEMRATAKKIQEYDTFPTYERSRNGSIDKVFFGFDFSSAMDAENLYNELLSLNIYSWEEEQTDGGIRLVVDNGHEINKLAFLNIIHDPAAQQSPTDLAYSFPLPHKKIDRDQPDKKPSIPTPDNEQEPGIDTDLQVIIEKFDAGEQKDEVVVKAKSKYHPNMRQFKREYFFENGIFKTKDGHLISQEEQKEILFEAKESPEAMERAVKMSTGIVKYKLDQVLDRFQPNQIVDADDLFQAGMEGLLYGLEHIDSDRENSNPAAYLFICVEGSIRSELRQHKPLLRRTHNLSDNISKYHQAENRLKKENPDYELLPQLEKDLLVAQELDMSLIPIRRASKVIHSTVELFDELEHTPEEYDDGPLKGIELQDLKDLFDAKLDTLEPRTELIIRMYYGITDSSRWGSPEELVASLGEAKGTDPMQSGTLKKLLDYNPAIEDVNELNNAEKVLLALIGKLPKEEVAEPYEGDNPTTLEELGAVFGVTRDRIRQIMNRGLRMMKHKTRSSDFMAGGYIKPRDY